MTLSEKLFCAFTLEEKQYLGELMLSGEDTQLLLHSRHPIPYNPTPHTIFGESVDYKKISLYECVGDRSFQEGTYPRFVHKRTSFPHYLVIGQRHLEAHERVFHSVSFSTDDLGLIFSNRGTFGAIHPDPADLQALLDKSFTRKQIRVANNPLVFYFSGTQGNNDVDIHSGLFSVFLGFRTTISDHAGIQCTSETTATLKFKSAKTVSEIIDELIALSLFMTTIAGRYQSISQVSGNLLNPDAGAEPDDTEKLAIHWSFAPTVGKQEASNFRDIPITPQVDSEEFYEVFRRWRTKHDEWLPARLRIANLQRVGRDYDENRLVAAANAFDILPEDTYSESGELSASALDARAKCKAIMRAIDDGPERTKILETLSYWGGKNLTLKVLSRFRIVDEAFQGSLSGLSAVLTIAIKTRNYFVHGKENFGWPHYNDLLPFLTDALEFVFVASDLIDCGWSAHRWAATNPGHSHPLGAFMRNYPKQLAEFQRAEEEARIAKATR